MGTHCEPLSPLTYNGPGSQDQLEAILKVVGHLDQSDLSFITDPDVADQLKQVNEIPNKIDFKITFPKTQDELINILQSMLEFNP